MTDVKYPLNQKGVTLRIYGICAAVTPAASRKFKELKWFTEVGSRLFQL